MIENWTDEVNVRIQKIMRQVESLRQWSSQMEMTNSQTNDLLAPYNELLKSLYNEDLQLANLLDESDFVVGAYGDSIKHGKAPISVIISILEDTKKGISKLTEAIAGTLDKAVRRQVEPDVYGFAPGSIYIGFKVKDRDSQYLYEDDPVYSAVVKALKVLGTATRLISNKNSEKEIVEAIPERNIRVAAFEAIANFSPTKNSGIERIVFSGPVLGMEKAEFANIDVNSRLIARKLILKSEKMPRKPIRGIVSNIDVEKRTITIKYEDRKSFVDEAKSLVDHNVIVKDDGKGLDEIDEMLSQDVLDF